MFKYVELIDSFICSGIGTYTVLNYFRHKRVAFLDTDVGQTEFTPPGLLALTVIDKITPGSYVVLLTLCLFYVLDSSGCLE